jgi:hypothetical protein
MWAHGGPKVAAATLPALRGRDDAKDAWPSDVLSIAEPSRLGFPSPKPWFARMVDDVTADALLPLSLPLSDPELSPL